MSAPPRPAAVGAPRWFSAALALAVVDALATAQVVRDARGEANPLLAALMARAGVVPALVLRVAVALVLLTALLHLALRDRSAERALVLVAGVHGLVVLWHLLGRLFLLA